jgi:hypothetical protein
VGSSSPPQLLDIAKIWTWNAGVGFEPPRKLFISGWICLAADFDTFKSALHRSPLEISAHASRDGSWLQLAPQSTTMSGRYESGCSAGGLLQAGGDHFFSLPRSTRKPDR